MNKAELVKALRNATQAGMADCMKALDECNNDLEAAQNWLREKGIAKANKKAGAVAYEGVVKAEKRNNKALIIEVNSQTDFTAKNEQFIKLVNEIFDDLFKNINKTETIDPERQNFNGGLLKDAGVSLTATTGEKIAFRRGNMVIIEDGQTVGCYTHSNNKIATIVVLDKKVDDEVAKDIAMHAAAMSPKFLDEKSVDQEWLKNEREILRKQFHEELESIKDEKAKEQKMKREEIIVDGKVKKLLNEICLVNQDFVKDNSKTIEKYASEFGAKVIMMIRYELGEGIEKKVSNFADEVAAQMKK